MQRWLEDLYGKMIRGYLCKDDWGILIHRWLEDIYKKMVGGYLCKDD